MAHYPVTDYLSYRPAVIVIHGVGEGYCDICGRESAELRKALDLSGRYLWVCPRCARSSRAIVRMADPDETAEKGGRRRCPAPRRWGRPTSSSTRASARSARASDSIPCRARA
ncbi:MAG: hypothetical protein IKR86_08930 [Candidatus Methanomethylophilaceae archaeon]|nr:hypothetical protein [Candidatus Methanomethylophilaceae archaeon]